MDKKEYMKEYNKQWYKKNKEARKECMKKYNENNKEARKEYNKEWHENNKEAQNEYMKQWREANKEWYEKNKEANKEYIREYKKNRLATDPGFKIRMNLSTRLCMALKNNSKAASTLELLGCTIEQLKSHLESKFQEGMTFENYGEWHIDHIKPCCSFDLTDAEQQKICFHWSNLQPLWAKDNLSKGGR